MKNIHLIPTSQPSRLRYNLSNQLVLTKESYRVNYGEEANQHIYITNDEEIKDVRPHKGKWQLEQEQILNKFPTYLTDLSECKLVIMTTDQDLIKDGIQPIDDEFLEWFVKNPGCESVEVSYEVLKPFQSIDKGYILRLPDTDVLEKPKQETLEEVAEEYYIDNIFCDGITDFEHDIAIRCYIAGAKDQAERMYSEEDMISFATFYKTHEGKSFEYWGKDLFKEWFEQFKKK
jgi:hypothetical protein